MRKNVGIVTKAQLAQDLAALGLDRGDMVYVHTSMGRIGWIEGDAQSLIEAFLEVLGPEGTLAAPTHTLSFPGRAAPPYRPAETPTVLGRFPEAVRRYPGALRSGHASHSSAAIGARAAFLTENHDPANALAYHSPLHRLSRSGGKTLLLGVDHRANTAIHLAESLARLPYVLLPYDASWGSETLTALPDGSVRRDRQTEYPGCSEQFWRLEADFLRAGIVRRGRVGEAQAQLLDTGRMVELARQALLRQPELLLCRDESCPCCPARRKWMEGRTAAEAAPSGLL